MKNIHVLPTEKPSEFYSIDGKHKLANSTMAMDWYISSAGYKPYNIYITSDEEIKKGDWYLIEFNGLKITQCTSTEELISIECRNDCKKIILTTDQDLIKDGVQAIDDEFLEWFVKNPSCEFIKVELHVGSLRWSDSKNTYKIIIPQEKAKQETLEEAAENSVLNNIDMRATHSMGKFAEFTFIEGAKWQAEQDKNNYSEVFEWLANKDYLSDEVDIIQKEFEQFKKK